MRHEINKFQSKNHNLCLFRVNKISLSSYKFKRYKREDGYTRLAHFYKFSY